MLVFEEMGKPENPEKKSSLSKGEKQQQSQPWYWPWNLHLGHISGRWVLLPLHHHCLNVLFLPISSLMTLVLPSISLRGQAGSRCYSVTTLSWLRRLKSIESLSKDPGVRGTAIYGLYWYVPLWRVWFSSSLLWDRVYKSERLGLE